MGKRKKEEQLALWIVGGTGAAFGAGVCGWGCVFAGVFRAVRGSTAADAYEVFLETPLAYNYFREIWGEWMKKRLTVFKLAAIYHTIRTVRRRKVDWTGHACGQG